MNQNADLVHLVRRGYLTACGMQVIATVTPRTTRYASLTTCPECRQTFTADEYQDRTDYASGDDTQ